jgi:hypothetical protein
MGIDQGRRDLFRLPFLAIPYCQNGIFCPCKKSLINAGFGNLRRTSSSLAADGGDLAGLIAKLH